MGEAQQGSSVTGPKASRVPRVLATLSCLFLLEFHLRARPWGIRGRNIQQAQASWSPRAQGSPQLGKGATGPGAGRQFQRCLVQSCLMLSDCSVFANSPIGLKLAWLMCGQGSFLIGGQGSPKQAAVGKWLLQEGAPRSRGLYALVIRKKILTFVSPRIFQHAYLGIEGPLRAA